MTRTHGDIQTSVFLARLIGPSLAIVGIGMLLAPASYAAVGVELVQSRGLIYFASLLGLLGGIALVLTHNVWIVDWRVIITLLGWISIFDSTTWILIPRQLAQFWLPMLQTTTFSVVGGIIVLLLGAVLCYFGFFATSIPANRD